MKRFLPFIMASAFIMLGCASNSNQNNQLDTPTVTVSILPLKYFVEQIAGQTVQVKVLVPPGSSPEMFEPQPNTMVDFSKSNLYFAIGLIDFEKGLEPKLDGEKTKFVNLSVGADLIEGLCEHEHEEHNADEDHDHHHHGIDPHIWMSCKEAKRISQIIANELSAAYSQNSQLYSDNLKKQIALIDSIDSEITAMINESGNKYFLIYHPSLGYFAKDYGLNQVSIEFEGKNPSAKGIVNTIRAAKAAGITTVMAQSQFDTKNATAVAAELNGNVVEIDPLAEDWTNQMLHIAKSIAKK